MRREPRSSPASAWRCSSAASAAAASAGSAVADGEARQDRLARGRPVGAALRDLDRGRESPRAESANSATISARGLETMLGRQAAGASVSAITAPSAMQINASCAS